MCPDLNQACGLLRVRLIRIGNMHNLYCSKNTLMITWFHPAHAEVSGHIFICINFSRSYSISTASTISSCHNIVI